MKDFIAHINGTSAGHRTHKYTPFFLFYKSIAYSQDYIIFVAIISTLTEPTTYQKAKESSDWVNAMQQELEALELNNTWILTSLPAGKKSIASTWVYKIKYILNGIVDKFKARLVGKAITSYLEWITQIIFLLLLN